MAKLMDAPSSSVDLHTDSNLEKYYSVLRDKKSGFREISGALFQILEKVGNIEDCFWISHAWAESLIQGKTIAKQNFPHGGVIVRSDALYKKGTPDYKGVHVSHGVEAYLITNWTKGVNKDLAPREYHNLTEIAGDEALHQYLKNLQQGQLVLLLTGVTSKDNGHVVLAAKLNGQIIIIDNSMEPGAWVKTWDQFKEEVWRYYQAYLYPEHIHSISEVEETKPRLPLFTKLLNIFTKND